MTQSVRRTPSRRVSVVAATVITLLGAFAPGESVPFRSWLAAAAGADGADGADGRDDVRTLLSRYCVDCHGSDIQEAGVRLDGLGPPFHDPTEHALWSRVREALERGVMPPTDADQPTRRQRRLLVNRLLQGWEAAAQDIRARRASHQLRRMTVEEYNYTLQSLFDVDAQFAETLPADPVSADGYRNDADLLGFSSLQLDYYLEIARDAVDRYVVVPEQDERARPQPILYSVEFEDVFYTVRDRVETRKRAPQPIGRAELERRRNVRETTDPEFGYPLSPLPPGVLPVSERLRRSQPKLHQQYLAIPDFLATGELIVRIRAAAAVGRDGSLPRMRVECGVAYGDGDMVDAVRLGETDVTASAEGPQTYEFRIRMEDVPQPKDTEPTETIFEMLQLFISNVSRDDQAIYELGPGSYDIPAQAAVQKNKKRLATAERDRETVLAQLEQMANAGANFLHLDAVEIEMLPHLSSSGPARWTLAPLEEASPDAERAAVRGLLEEFMPQAYRRPVATAEVEAKVALFDRLHRNDSFGKSVRETLVAVLVSPHFLLVEPTLPRQSADGPPSAYRTASRLSYLLWLSMPDERLFALAESGKLAGREVLLHEANRLLEDPRSRRFIEDFGRQWLQLDRLDLVRIHPEHHADYDSDLAELWATETLATLGNAFHRDATALDLIESDFALLNARLASHYGLPPVVGGNLQRVQLPAESRRGGLLTQAALLTIGSDGKDSHPIRRGVWILDRLLNDPPPPPPPNVPELTETAPAVEDLSLKERLEQHRSSHACSGCHEKIDPWGLALEEFDAMGKWRTQEEDVTLDDGTAIDDIRQLKQYVLGERREQFTESLVHHLMTYALGRRLDLADRWEARQIHAQFVESGYQLRSLVLAIVASDAFRR